jgi:hypothetical protein
VITGFTPANGTSGEAVTITGADLTNAYAVRFNGSEATFEDVSDTTIIASVPPGASTGPISVSGRGGTATTGDSFTVVLEGQLPSLAQHTLATGKNAKPSASWPAATSDGDLLVAGIGWSGNGVLTAPPGWTLAAQMGSTQIYFVQGAASQSGTITFSLSARGSWVLGLMEWTGVAPIGALDRQATNTSKGTSGTLADSGTTPATSQAVEVDVAVLHALKGVSQAGPTNGFSQVDEASVGSGNTTGLYAKTPTVIGSQEVSASLSAPSKWRGAIATFKAA